MVMDTKIIQISGHTDDINKALEILGNLLVTFRELEDYKIKETPKKIIPINKDYQPVYKFKDFGQTTGNKRIQKYIDKMINKGYHIHTMARVSSEYHESNWCNRTTILFQK